MLNIVVLNIVPPSPHNQPDLRSHPQCLVTDQTSDPTLNATVANQSSDPIPMLLYPTRPQMSPTMQL